MHVLNLNQIPNWVVWRLCSVTYMRFVNDGCPNAIAGASIQCSGVLPRNFLKWSKRRDCFSCLELASCGSLRCFKRSCCIWSTRTRLFDQINFYPLEFQEANVWFNICFFFFSCFVLFCFAVPSILVLLAEVKAVPVMDSF